jgi:hypothetical protein
MHTRSGSARRKIGPANNVGKDKSSFIMGTFDEFFSRCFDNLTVLFILISV